MCHSTAPPESHIDPKWAILDSAIMVSIVVGNVLTIAAVRCNRPLWTLASNKLIFSLAIGDLFLGCILPLHMALYLCPDIGEIKPVCLLQFVLLILGGLVSFFNILAIAIDRYIAILHPLRYRQYVTSHAIAACVALIWAVSFFVSSVAIYWNNYVPGTYCPMDNVLHPKYIRCVATPIYLVTWLTMFFVYCRIWLEASRHRRKMLRRHSGTTYDAADWKSVQVVLMVLGCFTVCWLPYFVLACSRSYGLFNTTIYKATYSLAMANSGMNPVIYAWKNREFREAFGRILRCRPPGVEQESVAEGTGPPPPAINSGTASATK